MGIAELKKVVEDTNREERIFLAAYLQHVERRDNPAHRKGLDSLCDEVSSGRRYSLERFRDLHYFRP